MLHGSRVSSFPVSTVIRTANSFNKSAAKRQTDKCYNIVHKALMISSFYFDTFIHFLHSGLSSGWSVHQWLLIIFSPLFLCLEDSFEFLLLWYFLSNNALLTLMVPYASDSAPWGAAICSLWGCHNLLSGWFFLKRLNQGSVTNKIAPTWFLTTISGS